MLFFCKKLELFHLFRSFDLKLANFPLFISKLSLHALNFWRNPLNCDRMHRKLILLEFTNKFNEIFFDFNSNIALRSNFKTWYSITRGKHTIRKCLSTNYIHSVTTVLCFLKAFGSICRHHLRNNSISVYTRSITIFKIDSFASPLTSSVR